MSQRIGLGQYIVQHTAHSRRRVFALVRDGEVSINGEVVSSMTFLVNPKRDTVVVQGDPVQPQGTGVYYKFYKPLDIISSMADSKGRKDLRTYVDSLKQPVFPVGRLDRNTKGLLLLTNDGSWCYRLTHPSFHVSKRYIVGLDKPITKMHLRRLVSGIFLDDGPVMAISATLQDPKTVEISVDEGRNRLVRRTFEFLGYKVAHLTRVSIGPIQLGTLQPGKIQRLTRGEIESMAALLAQRTNPKVD